MSSAQTMPRPAAPVSRPVDAALEPRALRDALGHFATGVTIISTLDAQGEPVGITVNSFNSVSLMPPLVLWSLARSAWSMSVFDRAERYAIHVLATDQRELSDRFARASSDKFAGVEWRPGRDGVPLIAGCVAVFQCRSRHRYDGGDHVIHVGEVEQYELRDRAALVFHRGRYGVVGEHGN